MGYQAEKGFFGKPSVRIAAVAMLILGAGAYGWKTYGRYTQGLPPTRPERPPEALQARPPAGAPALERHDGPPSPEERQKAFTAMLDRIDFTPEQRQKLEALNANGMPRSREEWEQRHQAMEQIATPEQLEQMRQGMRAGMQGRMQQRLESVRGKVSPKDFELLQQRMKAMQARGGPGGGMGRPGGGGPGR